MILLKEQQEAIIEFWFKKLGTMVSKKLIY